MKKSVVTVLLGLTAVLAAAGCGKPGRNEEDDRYAAGWSDGQAYETDDTGHEEYEDYYDPETGLYNPDAGYYYGSKERHSILVDPDDYEPGNR